LGAAPALFEGFLYGADLPRAVDRDLIGDLGR
jgi:hypothetical protein